MSTYAAMQQRAEAAGLTIGTAGSDQEVNEDGIPTPRGGCIILASGEIRCSGFGSTDGMNAHDSFMTRMGMIVDPRSGAWVSRADLPDYAAIEAANAKYNQDQLDISSRWFQSQGGSAIDKYGQPIPGTQTNPGGNPEGINTQGQIIKPVVAVATPVPASTFAMPNTVTKPDVNARFLTNGVTTDGAGNVLNVNRDQDKATMTAPASLPPNPYLSTDVPQQLPTNNTTAVAAPIDWKKYAPIIAGLVLLIIIVVAFRSRGHAA